MVMMQCMMREGLMQSGQVKQLLLIVPCIKYEHHVAVLQVKPNKQEYRAGIKTQR